mmetsp:Transcript_45471/g.137846  ORF Transcript_45471/g.137846 Transcript_45471/m.137846 type:complete len:246 (+) Transcript_45471:1271-2008(+)
MYVFHEFAEPDVIRSLVLHPIHTGREIDRLRALEIPSRVRQEGTRVELAGCHGVHRRWSSSRATLGRGGRQHRTREDQQGILWLPPMRVLGLLRGPVYILRAVRPIVLDIILELDAKASSLGVWWYGDDESMACGIQTQCVSRCVRRDDNVLEIDCPRITRPGKLLHNFDLDRRRAVLDLDEIHTHIFDVSLIRTVVIATILLNAEVIASRCARICGAAAVWLPLIGRAEILAVSVARNSSVHDC